MPTVRHAAPSPSTRNGRDLALRLCHRYAGLHLARDVLLRGELELTEDALLRLWLGNLDPAFLEARHELPWPDRAVLSGNAWEWLIVQGEAQLGDVVVPVAALVLAGEGPSHLDAEQRRWLERASAFSVGVYEVLASWPGEGFRVRDLASSAELEVRYPWRYAAIREGSIVGLRLVHDDDGWVVSSSFYGFDRGARGELEGEIALIRRDVDDTAARPWILGQAVMEIWALRLLAAARG